MVNDYQYWDRKYLNILLITTGSLYIEKIIANWGAVPR